MCDSNNCNNNCNCGCKFTVPSGCVQMAKAFECLDIEKGSTLTTVMTKLETLCKKIDLLDTTEQEEKVQVIYSNPSSPDTIDLQSSFTLQLPTQRLLEDGNYVEIRGFVNSTAATATKELGLVIDTTSSLGSGYTTSQSVFSNISGISELVVKITKQGNNYVGKAFFQNQEGEVSLIPIIINPFPETEFVNIVFSSTNTGISQPFDVSLNNLKAVSYVL